MEKNKLLFIPFFAGLVLMVYSWFVSYPLSVTSVDDFVFNHVSVFYWVSLPLLLASMYMMAVTFKSKYLKWVITVFLIMTIYSLSYFYYTLPTSDSHFFRGLTEYFIKTKNLDVSQTNQMYFQWPSFFLLSDMATSVSAMELVNFEFLLYAIIGFLLTTAMYVYASNAFKKWGFSAVAAFFIGMFHFLNYQWAPFSLAFGLLFLLFMIENRQKTFNIAITMLVLYTSIVFTHAFVALFFALYLLFRYVLDKSKLYGGLFLLNLTIYLIVQITQAPYSFAGIIRGVFTLPSEYSSILEATLTPISVPIDVVASFLSKAITVLAIVMCFVGFIILLRKRKLRNLDKAIFLTGIAFATFGSVFHTLGSRSFAIVFIPISLGAVYLLQSRFRQYVISFFLVLLMLFVFAQIHSSFFDSEIFFQTKEAYHTENFMIDNYNWTNPSFILAHVRVQTYLEAKQPSIAIFEDDVYSPLFPRLKEYDTIVYTVGLGKNLLNYNYTTEKILREEILNVVYNNGFSYVAIKS